jgi:hypothetical protein
MGNQGRLVKHLSCSTIAEGITLFHQSKYPVAAGIIGVILFNYTALNLKSLITNDVVLTERNLQSY